MKKKTHEQVSTMGGMATFIKHGRDHYVRMAEKAAKNRRKKLKNAKAKR